MCVGAVFWGTVVWETTRSRARSVNVRHWPRMFRILHTVQEQQQVAVWLPEMAAAAAMCVCVLSKWTLDSVLRIALRVAGAATSGSQ